MGGLTAAALDAEEMAQALKDRYQDVLGNIRK
jgi:hypothetical protein